MSDARYTPSELDRAGRLRDADESLASTSLRDIVDMMRAIPAAAYEHPSHESSTERSR
jgi:hypothetical protein